MTMKIRQAFRRLRMLRISVAVCSPSALAQGGTGPAWNSSPEAEAWAEGVASSYAALSGDVSLVEAIAAGEVNVYPGDPGEGNVACSFPGEGDTPPIIVVAQPPNAELAGAGAIHEWEHIKNNHSRLPAGCDPTDAQLSEAACNECAAHCAVLQSIYFRWLEYQVQSHCSLKRMVEASAAATCRDCELGVGIAGPPSAPPCGGTQPVPCYQ